MVKILYQNAEVDMKIIRGNDNLPKEVLFYNPHLDEYVENVREVTQGWNYNNEDDNKAMEEIIRFIEVIEWDDFLTDVLEDDDTFRLRFIPMEVPGFDGVVLDKVDRKDFLNKYIKIKDNYEQIGSSHCGSFEWWINPEHDLILIVKRHDEEFIMEKKGSAEFEESLRMFDRLDYLDIGSDLIENKENLEEDFAATYLLLKENAQLVHKSPSDSIETYLLASKQLIKVNVAEKTFESMKFEECPMDFLETCADLGCMDKLDLK